MQEKQNKTALVWFRNDLRVNDQYSLFEACKTCDTVLAVYVFDTQQFQTTKYGFKKTGKFRVKFLIETVKELKKSLQSLNISLFTPKGDPKVIIKELVKEFKVTDIFLQKEWTLEETMVTDSVFKTLPQVTKHEVYDQFLFHPDDIPYNSFDKIPDIFTQFRKKCEKYGDIKNVLPQPQVMLPVNVKTTTGTVPTMAELGYEEFEPDTRSAFPFKGGEKQAIKRIEHYFWETKKLQFYKKTRNGLIGTDYSSKLSAWLANGSISARTVYHEIKRFEEEVKKNQDTYWLIFELIWRDYFKYVSLKYGNRIFYLGGILNKDYHWANKDENFENWSTGNTSEPFVNANMKELLQTGWMSNRGRQNVASFWSKELKEDWRKGTAWFESMLIDYDVHSNWGNWMYNSGVGNDPRDRKFNIKRQAEMYDANGKFQRHWLQDSLF